MERWECHPGRGDAHGCADPDPYCAGGALAACLTLAALACYWALLRCPARLLALLHSPAAEAAAACAGLAAGALFVGLVLRTALRTVSSASRAEREDALGETAHRATLLVVACLGGALWYLVVALRAMPWAPPGMGGA